MRNRLGSGKPCANGGTELTLIGYFTMSEGLALRFDSDVSGNSAATIGAVSCDGYSERASTSRTCVSNATGISAAVCICTGCYADSRATIYPGHGGCVVMAGSSGTCTIVYFNGTSIATISCSFTVTSTGVTQSYVYNYGTTYFFSPCTVIYF